MFSEGRPLQKSRVGMTITLANESDELTVD